MEREREAEGEKEREERRREKKKSLTFFFSFSNQPSSSQRTRLALDAVRECYEAYVIYNFFMYLRAYLEDEYGDVDAYFAAKDDVPHLGPLKRVLRPWRMGAPFFRECQQGVLAYVVVRPLMSVAGLLASALGVGGGMSGGEGPFRADRAFVWAALANNASQVWALYCLVLFYTGTRHELAPIRPLSKFLVVKAVRMLFLFPRSFFLSFFLSFCLSCRERRREERKKTQPPPPSSPSRPQKNKYRPQKTNEHNQVVFASYGQGIAIGALVWSKVLTPPDWAKGDVDDAAAALQEFLICVEMAFAALAHAYAFPPSDYADPAGPPSGGAGGGGLAANFGAMFSVDDVLSDVRGAVDVAAGRAAGAVGAAGAGAWGQARAVGSGVARAPAALLAAAFGVGGTGKGREGGRSSSGGGGGALGSGLSEDGRQHSQDALWTEDELR